MARHEMLGLQDIPFGSISQEVKIEVCKKIKRESKVNVVGALYGDAKAVLFFTQKKNGCCNIL